MPGKAHGKYCAPLRRWPALGGPRSCLNPTSCRPLTYLPYNEICIYMCAQAPRGSGSELPAINWKSMRINILKIGYLGLRVSSTTWIKELMEVATNWGPWLFKVGQRQDLKISRISLVAIKQTVSGRWCTDRSVCRGYALIMVR